MVLDVLPGRKSGPKVMILMHLMCWPWIMIRFFCRAWLATSSTNDRCNSEMRISAGNSSQHIGIGEAGPNPTVSFHSAGVSVFSSLLWTSCHSSWSPKYPQSIYSYRFFCLERHWFFDTLAICSCGAFLAVEICWKRLSRLSRGRLRPSSQSGFNICSSVIDGWWGYSNRIGEVVETF